MSVDLSPYFLAWMCPVCGARRKIALEDRWGQVTRGEACQWCVPLQGTPLMKRMGIECPAQVNVVEVANGTYAIMVDGKHVRTQLFKTREP